MKDAPDLLNLRQVKVSLHKCIILGNIEVSFDCMFIQVFFLSDGEKEKRKMAIS